LARSPGETFEIYQIDSMRPVAVVVTDLLPDVRGW